MATVIPSVRLSGLARRLVTEGYISEGAAVSAVENAQKKKQTIVDYMVGQQLVSAQDMMTAASNEFGIPVLDLGTFDLERLPKSLINEKTVRNHCVLPLYKRGNQLFVAIADPTKQGGLDEIKFSAGMRTEPILVERDKLEAIMDKVLDIFSPTMQALMDQQLDTLELTPEEGETGEELDGLDIDDAPVVRFIHKLMLDAITKGASDIHCEPFDRLYRVRMRVDGILHDVASPPASLAMRIASRIKVMARLDISERRIPQDGRIRLKVTKRRAINFRVSTCPTLYGEKVVLRLLDTSNALLSIDKLGFDDRDKKLYLDILKKPWGMILVTGPTGSGKTVTLYTGLSILNTVDKNICTAEDPVEIFLPGINQVNVHPKVGLDFATALRAFLRQDPDVIMLGEIRDLETAEIAIKAAQTGHLVLSTLHTNDAPQTLTRLANMGVPHYNIASAVSLIMAQRLCRRLCENCKQPNVLPRGTLLEEGFSEQEAGTLKIYKAIGCEHCMEGYKGRVAIYQVMPISPAIEKIILVGGGTRDLSEQASKEGMPSLRVAGLKKVREGITSLDEINRVTKD